MSNVLEHYDIELVVLYHLFKTTNFFTRSFDSFTKSNSSSVFLKAIEKRSHFNVCLMM